jgi:hypothetical protein
MCCIIVSKPAGIPLPSIETLQNCWKRNSHGAGYAVAKDGAVHIRKGFMTWESFANIDFAELTPFACILHFRYATHGSQSPGNCHPFPVTGNLRSKTRTTDVAIAHNGVIHGVAITKPDYSDTMSYIEQSIAPYWKRCKKRGSYMYSMKASKRTLLDETNSKWAFLYPNGSIINVGRGIKEHGLWFSNSSYRGYTYSFANSPRMTMLNNRSPADDDWNSYPDEMVLLRPLAMAGYF